MSGADDEAAMRETIAAMIAEGEITQADVDRWVCVH